MKMFAGLVKHNRSCCGEMFSFDNNASYELANQAKSSKSCYKADLKYNIGRLNKSRINEASEKECKGVVIDGLEVAVEPLLIRKEVLGFVQLNLGYLIDKRKWLLQDKDLAILFGE